LHVQSQLASAGWIGLTRGRCTILKIAGRLCCEKVPVDKIVREHGTPVYIYSNERLTEHFQRLDAALGLAERLICYAVKANSNLAVLRTLADLGSGFDIVSEGELRRVMAAGGDPGRCVFAGVGKSAREIEFALRQGVYCFNVESEAELLRIDRVAGRLRKTAPVAVRVNPNVDAHTHAKITTGTYENKFGIAFERVEAVYARAAKLKHIRLRGLQMHIGSQLTEVEPFEQAVRRVVPLAQRLAAVSARVPQHWRGDRHRLRVRAAKWRAGMVAARAVAESAHAGDLRGRVGAAA
jgi:diaminopimelate decarboxylase